MPSQYAVYIKSATPLVTTSQEEGDVNTCSLRLGQHLISTRHDLVKQLPVLAELASQQESVNIISLSSLLKHQPCLTPYGIRFVIDFLNGKEVHVEAPMVADLLAAANALQVDDLISQVEQELVRLSSYDASALFSLEHAVLNMDVDSSTRHLIIKTVTLNLEKISAHRVFSAIKWPTFEALMKEAAISVPPTVFMNAFLKWAKDNRQDQSRACSLLLSCKFHELTVIEKEEFAQRSAALYLHGVSSTMSKLVGSTPMFERRVLTQRWSACSDLSVSVSSSIDVIAIHEEPFTNTNITVDCSQLSESGRIYTDVDDSIIDSMMEKEDEMDSCFGDFMEEECSRLGAGADRCESSRSVSTATSTSSRCIDPIETKMIDFGTIPIPDGDVKQIMLSIELDDNEKALEYIRKMRFHFDMEVDPKN